MGHKSNPIGLRLQINRTWDSRWYAEGADYGRLLLEDLNIRKYIMKSLPQAAISKVVGTNGTLQSTVQQGQYSRHRFNSQAVN